MATFKRWTTRGTGWIIGCLCIAGAGCGQTSVDGRSAGGKGQDQARDEHNTPGFYKTEHPDWFEPPALGEQTTTVFGIIRCGTDLMAAESFTVRYTPIGSPGDPEPAELIIDHDEEHGELFYLRSSIPGTFFTSEMGLFVLELENVSQDWFDPHNLVVNKAQITHTPPPPGQDEGESSAEAVGPAVRAEALCYAEPHFDRDRPCGDRDGPVFAELLEQEVVASIDLDQIHPDIDFLAEVVAHARTGRFSNQAGYLERPPDVVLKPIEICAGQ